MKKVKDKLKYDYIDSRHFERVSGIFLLYQTYPLERMSK